jgi:hypothetical protein
MFERSGTRAALAAEEFVSRYEALSGSDYFAHSGKFLRKWLDLSYTVEPAAGFRTTPEK